MTNPNAIGHACFFSSNGIQSAKLFGALTAFDSTHGRKQLAACLRVPGLKLSMQDEPLAFSVIEHGESAYRLATLYQRESATGYKAVSIALRDCWADPNHILEELRLLSEVHHTKEEVSPFSPHLETYRAPKGRTVEAVDLFIPLTLGHREEQAMLLQGWINELSHDFRTIWASASSEVRAVFKQNQTSIRLHNPYWHWEDQRQVWGG